MSDYSATVTDHSATATQEYDSGGSLEVEVTAGFVYIRIDGEVVEGRYETEITEKSESDTPTVV